MRTRLALLATLLSASPLVAGDLTKTYPATLDAFEGQPAREWTCTKDDVWELDSFHFDFQGRLDITLGKSVVVFGVCEKNAVWAVVFPDKPAKLKSKLGGDGEQVTSLFLRFNPKMLGELFPVKTVGKNGPEDQIAWARRIYTHKINIGWHAGSLLFIPKKGSIGLDCETAEGHRHCFFADKDLGTLELYKEVEDKPLPALVKMDKLAAARAFDTVWDAFDKEYAKFGYLPKLDWKKAGEEWRKIAAKATTTYGAAAAIDGLVAQLHDLHAWVMCGDEGLPGFYRERPLNASYKAVQNAVKDLTDTKHSLSWGHAGDGIGYVLIDGLEDHGTPGVFDEVLTKLADCKGLIVDLRFNGGGQEDIAASIASRFVDQKRVYSVDQFRIGPKHDQLGPKLERTIEPRAPRWEQPVVCLQGQKTFSSAESMALMFAQCPQVTTMGDKTGGSSGAPRTLELEGGIKVNLPRWIDMDPAGNPIENVGVAPKVQIDAKPAEFTAVKDPVLDAALEFLRKAPKSVPGPGKTGKH